jgi:regulator of protease activity HflC (stomatin/prohibitin superfamily)
MNCEKETPMDGFVFIIVLVALLLAFLSSAIRILREYERGVVFSLGRYTGVKGPGLIIIIPFIQQMVRVDLRTLVLDVPSQDVISKDNVSVRVNAVIYFRVIDPDKATIQVENYMQATSELSQTTLRSVLGKHDLDEMLSERDKLNADIQEILDRQTDAWGIKVQNVEIKHVDINESMIRAIARQAEAERERRARVIDAEGEQQAAAKLLEAADILARTPQAMQLRYLSTLQSIGGEKNSTIVFPFPTDLAQVMSSRREEPRGEGAAGRAAAARRPEPRRPSRASSGSSALAPARTPRRAAPARAAARPRGRARASSPAPRRRAR